MKTLREPEIHALVTVRWGDTVVATKHLTEGASATLGADIATLAPIPCEPLGLASVVVAEVRGGAPIAFVPRGAVGFRERPRMLPAPLSGPSEISLAAGDTVSFTIGQFLVVITAEEADKAPWAAAPPLAATLLPARHFVVAALAHALLIGLSAQAAQAASFETTEDHADMQRYLAAADDRARALERIDTDLGSADLGRNVNEHDGNGKDGGGTRARGKEGAMGSAAVRIKEKGRFAVSGGKPGDDGGPRTREEAIADARAFGMAGMLAAERTPVSAFASAVAARGPDAFDSRGALWATAVGETFGSGGLGLSGVGEGGGGSGDGIGLGSIGTFGHSFGRPGLGTGGGGHLPQLWASGTWWDGWTYYTSHVRGRAIPRTEERVAHGQLFAFDLNPGERPEKADEEGENRLPPDVIRRIVRANSGAFRACYQAGLLTNGGLHGGVTTRFLIGADGHVKSAQNLGTDLPDKKVVSCVTRAFYGLVFPEPPAGRPVTVTYPLTFSPSH